MGALDEVAGAAGAVRDADACLAQAIRRAREDGVRWPVIAEAAGLTVEATRWRAGERRPSSQGRRAASEAARAERQVARLESIQDSAARADLGVEVVSVAEAARLLGVSRATVYRKLGRRGG